MAFRALRAAAVAIWIVKAAMSNTPRTVKTLFRILVSIERALLKDNRIRLVRRPRRLVVQTIDRLTLADSVSPG